ncbi:MAG TPA: dicarboxylate/amino acid:cation symporter [Anaeromyxobacteraceae bacterium]|nr:dicarboxylate/amino acid:cation symporter [Anaeromyxobacteraceae bacterium]
MQGFAAAAEPIAQAAGQLFIRLLVAVVIPLAATSLTLAIADLDPAAIGRLGRRLLLYAAGSSLVAALIGLLLVIAVGPGRGLPAALREAAPRAAAGAARTGPSVGSPLTAAFVALVVATLALGLALGRLRGPRVAALRAGVEALHRLSTGAAGWVMRLAPLGIGALLFTTALRLGTAAIRPLLAYVAVVIGGLLLHGGVVYALAVRFLGGMSPWRFFAGVRAAMATAFSTASSAATLPTSLRVAEEELRLPPATARLVLTAGSAMNQNGTTLFEGVTVLFLAQVYGVDLSLLQQAGILGISVLAGIGSAGVPGGGTFAIATLLLLFGIPVEGVGLIAGVDRLLDMCRTTVNVTGDLVLAVIVARGSSMPVTPHCEAEPGGNPP